MQKNHLALLQIPCWYSQKCWKNTSAVWFMWPWACYTLPSFTYICVICHYRQILSVSLFILTVSSIFVFFEQSWKWSTCGLQFNANVQGNAKDVSKKQLSKVLNRNVIKALYTYRDKWIEQKREMQKTTQKFCYIITN